MKPIRKIPDIKRRLIFLLKNGSGSKKIRAAGRLSRSNRSPEMNMRILSVSMRHSMKIKSAFTDYLSIQADNMDWLASRWLDRVAMLGNADHTSYFEYTPNGKKPGPLQFSFYGERV